MWAIQTFNFLENANQLPFPPTAFALPSFPSSLELSIFIFVVVVVVFECSHLVAIQPCVIIVLFSISLMTNQFEHFFTYFFNLFRFSSFVSKAWFCPFFF